jgi:D-alanyl-D-alanine carboxypeptidase (penicillin-binding protein 5/6)
MKIRYKRAIAYLVIIAVVVIVLSGYVFNSRKAYEPGYLKIKVEGFSSSGVVRNFNWPPSPQESAIGTSLSNYQRSQTDNPVPIASLTKMMTAYIILQDHPINPGTSGPEIAITAQDQSDYYFYINQGGSGALVEAGEKLSEYQLLEALLVPSADNIAILLAEWDSGNTMAFVNKMNSKAKALGMINTIYADPSGISPLNKSTPVDQMIVARQDMAIPVFRQIVALNHIVLPAAGWLPNFDPDLGIDNIIGVKTGFTLEAQGCYVFASQLNIAGNNILIIGAILGDNSPAALYNVGREAIGLLNTYKSYLYYATPLSSIKITASNNSESYRVKTSQFMPQLITDGSPFSYSVKPNNVNLAEITSNEVIGSLTIYQNNQPVIKIPLRIK